MKPPTLTKTLLEHPWRLLGAAALAAIVTVLGWSGAFFVQLVLDRTLAPSMLAIAAAGIVCLTLGRAAVAMARRRIQMGLVREVEEGLARSYFRRMLSLETSAYDAHRSGDLLRRLRGLDFFRRVLEDRVLGLLFDVVLLIGAAVILGTYSVTLMAITLGGGLLPTILVLANRRRVKTMCAESLQADGRLTHRILDALRGIRDLRMNGAEERFRRGMEAEYRVFQDRRIRHTSLVDGIKSLIGMGSMLVGVAVLLAGSGMLRAGEITPGELMFVFTMMGMMLGPLEQMASSWGALEDASVAMREFGEVFTLPRESEEPSGEAVPAGDIVLEDVTFGYEEARPVLRGISLTIPEGSTVALVGESGAGKSTLLALLAGLYAPTRGRLLIGGREVSREAWRRHVGAVLQQPHLFEGTVEENIRLGRPGVSPEQARRAAVRACADDFIRRRPEGYETKTTGDAALFSAGEVQRIALARALVRDPQVLLLDEATSHLDGATEEAVWSALRDGAENPTTIFISHRLRNAVEADRIVLLREGRIVEHGTFGELMRRKGFFHRLWRRQVPVEFTPDSWSSDVGEFGLVMQGR